MNNSQEQVIYREVRLLLEQMTPEMRAQAETLLARAERGEKTDIALLKLIRADRALAETLARRLAAAETSRSAYGSLPGEPVVSASNIYVCPQCEYTWHRQVAGQRPPECPTHHVPLIPYEQKAGR